MKNRQKNLLKHAKKAGHNAIVGKDPENLFYIWIYAIGFFLSCFYGFIAHNANMPSIWKMPCGEF